MSGTILKSNSTKKQSIPITKFETDVLKLLCIKKNIKEISEELGVSIHTIQAYKVNLLEKLQAKNLKNLKNLYFQK